MKKVICLILIAIMLLNAAAFAESAADSLIDVKSLDTESLLLLQSAIEAELKERNGADNTSRSFRLHGEVRFGMSFDEIETIEAQQGFTVQEKKENSCIFAGGTVAGVSEATITYGFDEAGKMFMMKYCFGPFRVYVDGDFNKYPIEVNQRLVSQLIQKYGESTAYSRPSGFSRDKGGNRVSMPATLYGIVINPLSFNGKVNSYEEWLREADDGYIFIQQAKLPIEDSDNNLDNNETCITVTYCFFDQDTFQGFNAMYGDDL